MYLFYIFLGRLGIPFGQAYVSLLLPVLRTNLALMKQRSQSIEKFDIIARLLPKKTLFHRNSAISLVSFFEDLIADIEFPILGQYNFYI